LRPCTRTVCPEQHAKNHACHCGLWARLRRIKQSAQERVHARRSSSAPCPAHTCGSCACMAKRATVAGCTPTHHLCTHVCVCVCCRCGGDSCCYSAHTQQVHGSFTKAFKSAAPPASLGISSSLQPLPGERHLLHAALPPMHLSRLPRKLLPSPTRSGDLGMLSLWQYRSSFSMQGGRQAGRQAGR